MISNRVIGNIVTINNNNIVAELSSDLGNYINLTDGIYFVGEIGSYIKIDDLNRRIIAEIIAIDEKNDMSFERLGKPGRNRYLKLSLIGEIIDSEFKFGVTKMPPIYSEIKIINENDLMLMLDVSDAAEVVDGENTRLLTLAIGTSIIFPQYEVRVKLDEFFGFHFAVFGNTGAGKSNTIARIIQKIFEKINYSAYGAKFIIFDSNGEYKTAFEKINNVNQDIECKFMTTSNDDELEKLMIPVWALSVDDWAVLLHATEKTQIPIIRRAVELIYVFFTNNNDYKKAKNHIISTVITAILLGADSSPSKYDKVVGLLSKFNTEDISLEKVIDGKSIQDTIKVSFGQMNEVESLINYCNDFIDHEEYKRITKTIEEKTYSLSDFLAAIELAILYEGSINSARIFEYTATLVTRLQHLIESEQGSFLIKTTFNNIEEYIESILGNYQVLNLDVSSLDDTATEVITKVFSKMLFDYIRKIKPRNSMPVNLILEEAHRYINSNMDYGVLGYNIFERIAREGRKFGILLGISSQRPSELSKTVVSQCSNFIIHRIQNPDDIRYISRMVPYISEGIIDRITYLQRGHALVFGTAVNLPTLTSFDKANPTPDSSNSNISKIWYKPKD